MLSHHVCLSAKNTKKEEKRKKKKSINEPFNFNEKKIIYWQGLNFKIKLGFHFGLYKNTQKL